MKTAWGRFAGVLLLLAGCTLSLQAQTDVGLASYGVVVTGAQTNYNHSYSIVVPPGDSSGSGNYSSEFSNSALLEVFNDLGGSTSNDEWSSVFNGIYVYGDLFNSGASLNTGGGSSATIANKSVPLLVDPTPAPEPSSWLLALAGVALLGGEAYRRRAFSPA